MNRLVLSRNRLGPIAAWLIADGLLVYAVRELAITFLPTELPAPGLARIAVQARLPAWLSSP